MHPCLVSACRDKPKWSNSDKTIDQASTQSKPIRDEKNTTSWWSWADKQISNRTWSSGSIAEKRYWKISTKRCFGVNRPSNGNVNSSLPHFLLLSRCFYMAYLGRQICMHQRKRRATGEAGKDKFAQSMVDQSKWEEQKMFVWKNVKRQIEKEGLEGGLRGKGERVQV